MNKQEAAEICGEFIHRQKAYDDSNLCLSTSDTFCDGNIVALIQHFKGPLEQTCGESHCIYLSAQQLDELIPKLSRLSTALKVAGSK